jgi:hypothetical protein
MPEGNRTQDPEFSGVGTSRETVSRTIIPRTGQPVTELAGTEAARSTAVRAGIPTTAATGTRPRLWERLKAFTEIPQDRPRTRAQTRAFGQPFQQQLIHNETSSSDSETETSDSDGERERHQGVTMAHTKRRQKLWKRFTTKFQDITATSIRYELIQACITRKKWAESTRLSYFHTLISEVKRRGLPMTGDYSGINRELTLAKIQAVTKRVPAIPIEHPITALTKCTMIETKVLIAMTWAFAARLTSITALTRLDIKGMKAVDDNEVYLTITFRSGKTILYTKRYTLTMRVPNFVANYISASPLVIFPKDIDQYYTAIRKSLKPYSTRGLRRGAVQHLAAKGTTPDTLMLITRHKNIESLYSYLDDGLFAQWETSKTADLAMWK